MNKFQEKDLMKKILALLVLSSSFCFAMSEQASMNLNICTEKEQNHKWASSIEFLKNLVRDESISNVDKIHYHQRLKMIHQISHDVFSYLEESEKISDLCEKYPECNIEYISHYGYN